MVDRGKLESPQIDWNRLFMMMSMQTGRLSRENANHLCRLKGSYDYHLEKNDVYQQICAYISPVTIHVLMATTGMHLSNEQIVILSKTIWKACSFKNESDNSLRVGRTNFQTFDTHKFKQLLLQQVSLDEGIHTLLELSSCILQRKQKPSLQNAEFLSPIMNSVREEYRVEISEPESLLENEDDDLYAESFPDLPISARSSRTTRSVFLLDEKSAHRRNDTEEEDSDVGESKRDELSQRSCTPSYSLPLRERDFLTEDGHDKRESNRKGTARHSRKKNGATCSQKVLSSLSKIPGSVFAIALFLFSCNVGMTIWGAMDTTGKPIAIRIARAAGKALNLDASIILLSTCQAIMSAVRASVKLNETKAVSILLSIFDHAAFIHVFLALNLIILSLIHIVAHVVGYSTDVENINTSGWINGSGFATGIILASLLIVIVTFAPFRKSGGLRYKLFQLTHILVLPFEVVMLCHSEYYWIWFIGCGVIYIVDVGLRLFIFKRLSTIERVELYWDCYSAFKPEAVQLKIRRPKNFDFDCGSFVWLRVPSLSSCSFSQTNATITGIGGSRLVRLIKFLTRTGLGHEFHPFSICSAPEDKDYLCLAIRVCGDWTMALHQECQRELKQLDGIALDAMTKDSDIHNSPSKSLQKRIRWQYSAHCREAIAYHSTCTMPLISNPIKVEVFGPHGAPCNFCSECRHPILVTTGIAITPFISLLESFVQRWTLYRFHLGERAFDADLAMRSGFPATIHIFWIIRAATHANWFARLLDDMTTINLEREMYGMGPLFTLHLFVPSATISRSSRNRGTYIVGSLLIRMAVRLHFEENRRCLISKTTEIVRFVKPNWLLELSNALNNDDVSSQNDFGTKWKSPHEACVFVCGSSKLCEVLKICCYELKVPLRRENFA